jgi:hypothetical protein
LRVVSGLPSAVAAAIIPRQATSQPTLMPLRLV